DAIDRIGERARRVRVRRSDGPAKRHNDRRSLWPDHCRTARSLAYGPRGLRSRQFASCTNSRGEPRSQIMTALRSLQDEIERIGYSAIEADYTLADVFETSGANRRVALVAFTHSPPSYRNAAMAVVDAKGQDPRDIVSGYKALGAPLVFVIEGEQV